MTIKPRKLPYRADAPFSLAQSFKHRPHRPVVTILSMILLVFGIIIGISKPETLTFIQLISNGITLVVLANLVVLYLVFDLAYRLRKGQIVSVYFNDSNESARVTLTNGKGGYIDEAIPYEDFSFQSDHFPGRFILKDRSIWTFKRSGQKLGTVDSSFVAWKGEFYLLRKLNRKLRKMRDDQSDEDPFQLLPKYRQQQGSTRQKVAI